MTTLHVEIQVRDFASWKEVFDSFEGFRSEQRVRSHLIYRDLEQDDRVAIDMSFDSTGDATAFRGALEAIFATPQSQAQLTSHQPIRMLEEQERVGV